MKREEVDSFLSKKIFVRMKSRFFYRGKLVEVNSDNFLIDDIKAGQMLLSLSEIESISEYDESRNGFIKR